MRKPFDLEAAKRGEPIETMYYTDHSTAATWKPCHFVGLDRQGFPVIQRTDRDNFYTESADDLRMASKKTTVRYRVAVTLQNGWPAPVLAQTNEHVSNIGSSSTFVKWIHTDWQEVEIPQ